MKIKVLATIAAVALSAATLPTVAADDPTTWEKIKGFAHTQKENAVTEAKKMIAASDKQIDEMSKTAKQSGADAKAAHQQNMKELQAKKQQAQMELGKLEKSGANAWDATKEGFGKAYRDLSTAYHKAVATSK
jgi:hypothetical protein